MFILFIELSELFFSFWSVNIKELDSFNLSLFKINNSENKNISNSLLLSLNLTIAKAVPFALFFYWIDIIVPATSASLLLDSVNSL